MCFFSPVNDNRASLLRSSATVRKPVNERDVYMHIWKNYLTFGYRVVPPAPNPVVRCASPDLSLRYINIYIHIYIYYYIDNGLLNIILLHHISI